MDTIWYSIKYIHIPVSHFTVAQLLCVAWKTSHACLRNTRSMWWTVHFTSCIENQIYKIWSKQWNKVAQDIRLYAYIMYHIFKMKHIILNNIPFCQNTCIHRDVVYCIYICIFVPVTIHLQACTLYLDTKCLTFACSSHLPLHPSSSTFWNPCARPRLWEIRAINMNSSSCLRWLTVRTLES